MSQKSLVAIDAALWGISNCGYVTNEHDPRFVYRSDFGALDDRHDAEIPGMNARS